MLLLLLSINSVVTRHRWIRRRKRRRHRHELIALVEQLRKQVAEATVTNDANAKITNTSVSDDRSLSETSSRQPALDFRVLPDLDKTVGVFSYLT